MSKNFPHPYSLCDAKLSADHNSQRPIQIHHKSHNPQHLLILISNLGHLFSCNDCGGSVPGFPTTTPHADSTSMLKALSYRTSPTGKGKNTLLLSYIACRKIPRMVAQGGERNSQESHLHRGIKQATVTLTENHVKLQNGVLELKERDKIGNSQ
ncbi:hypothetical protein L484_021599 [Morus notabilis]|uniref:Uncharacterized protein n=1 Tax=Morus notabilis TaxID=981085 RepID=W9S5W7_9ROSA|nr:hypothetical protein L484_021599 [Morus notabilis]